MLNLKQEELVKQLVEEVREKFPEVQLLNVIPSPENPEDTWIRVTSPSDEDRETALIEFSADRTIDILLDYGYHMLVMPVGRSQDNGSQSTAAPLAVAN